MSLSINGQTIPDTARLAVNNTVLTGLQINNITVWIEYVEPPPANINNTQG